MKGSNIPISYLFLVPILICVSIGLNSCKIVQKTITGKEAYNAKQFDTAISLLTKEYTDSRNPESKSYAAYLAGKSALALNRDKDAISWLEKAVAISDNEFITKELARAYKINGNYKAAREVYRQLSQQYADPIYAKAMRSCESILNNGLAIPNPDYTISSISKEHKFNDFSPVIYNEFILLSSDQKSYEEDIYEGTGNYFSDLFLYSPKNKSYSTFHNGINSAAHEGTACFNKDLTEIFFTRCESIQLRNEHCRLYTSSKIQGDWIEPFAIAFFNENVNVGHPALFNNDSLLIFSVAPHGNYSSYDLYYSIRYDNGWSQASPMSDIINTDADEKFPTVYNDTLFFSSDKESGLGGLDIYKTYFGDDNNWVRPILMEAPINSSKDDFGLVVDEKNISESIPFVGYFSSARSDDGYDKIFKFEKKKVIETPQEPKADTTDIEVLDITYFIAGFVSDAQNNNPIKNASVTLISNDSITKFSSSKGASVFDAKGNIDYQLLISKDGYFTQKINLSTKGMEIDSSESSVTLNFKVALEKIKLNEEIVIKNIYYDYDQSFIREDAKPALEEVVQLLENNPSMKIELSSHTDCRGELDYNQLLSLKRAEAATAYINSKGIDNNRIIAKGYGETAPIDKCNCDNCTDDAHQKNRRTAFKVLSF